MTVTRILLESAKLWYQKDVKLFSAAFSYYAPIAIIPLVAISIGIVSLFFENSFVREFFLSWSLVLGQDLSALINSAVANLNAETSSFGAPLLGVIIFSGVSIMALNVLSAGFNQLWGTAYFGIKNWYHRTIRSIIFVFIMQIYFVLIVAFEFFLGVISLENVALISTTFIFINTALLFVVLYKFLPIASPSFKGCVFGGLVAAILFIGLKSLVGLLLEDSSALNLYGGAGLILVLLVWVYILAALIYYGAAVAYTYDKIYSNFKKRTLKTKIDNYDNH